MPPMNWSTSFLAACALSACAAGQTPMRPSPTLDGKVWPAEWQLAQRTPLGETGTLWLAHGEGTLHLALEDGADGIASVFLFDGARVHVLHASAALGTAVFVRTAEGGWRLEQDFAYEARNPDDGPAREAFWKKHGWLANVTSPGSGSSQRGGDREFRIDLARFQGSRPLRIAAGYLHVRPGALRVDPWPAGAQDGVADVALHAGDTQSDPSFAPAQWRTLAP